MALPHPSVQKLSPVQGLNQCQGPALLWVRMESNPGPSHNFTAVSLSPPDHSQQTQTSAPSKAFSDLKPLPTLPQFCSLYNKTPKEEGRRHGKEHGQHADQLHIRHLGRGLGQRLPLHASESPSRGWFSSHLPPALPLGLPPPHPSGPKQGHKDPGPVLCPLGHTLSRRPPLPPLACRWASSLLQAHFSWGTPDLLTTPHLFQQPTPTSAHPAAYSTLPPRS